MLSVPSPMCAPLTYSQIFLDEGAYTPFRCVRVPTSDSSPDPATTVSVVPAAHFRLSLGNTVPLAALAKCVSTGTHDWHRLTCTGLAGKTAISVPSGCADTFRIGVNIDVTAIG